MSTLFIISQSILPPLIDSGAATPCERIITRKGGYMGISQIHIRIPDQQKSQLEKIAEERGMAINQVIAYIIGNYINQYRKGEE